MKLTRYETAREWLARTQVVLEREEAKHNLPVGIAVRLAEHPDRIKTAPYLATVDEEDALMAAAVMTPPHRVIVSSQLGSNPTPLRLIVGSLLAEGWTVPGVVAESTVADAFAKEWSLASGQPYRPGMRQRIYELRTVIAPIGVPGQLSVATAEDLTLVTDWLERFTMDAHLPPLMRADIVSMAELRVEERDIFLWRLNDQPVSMAARSRHSSHGITVGPVYTPPELRRRGFASACVAALSQRLLDAGWSFCSLYTDLTNPTSNAIYQQIGYVPICDSQEYDFDDK